MGVVTAAPVKRPSGRLDGPAQPAGSPRDALGCFLDEQSVEHERYAARRAARRAALAALAFTAGATLLPTLLDVAATSGVTGAPATFIIAAAGPMFTVGLGTLVAALALRGLAPRGAAWRLGLDLLSVALLGLLAAVEVAAVGLFVFNATTGL